MRIMLFRNRVIDGRGTRVDTLSDQWLVRNRLHPARFRKRRLDKRGILVDLFVSRGTICSCREMLITI